VLNVLVPEVVLQGPRVVAIVGKLEPAGMAKHVRGTGMLAALPTSKGVRKNPAAVPLGKCNEFNARSLQKCRMP
jgi:hypothetical protein